MRDREPAKGLDVLASVVDQLRRCKGKKVAITGTPITAEDLVAGEDWSKPGYLVTTDAIRVGTWRAERTIADIVVRAAGCKGDTSPGRIRIDLSRPIVAACLGRAACEYQRDDFFAAMKDHTFCYQVTWRCRYDATPHTFPIPTVDAPLHLHLHLDCAPPSELPL